MSKKSRAPKPPRQKHSIKFTFTPLHGGLITIAVGVGVLWYLPAQVSMQSQQRIAAGIMVVAALIFAWIGSTEANKRAANETKGKAFIAPGFMLGVAAACMVVACLGVAYLMLQPFGSRQVEALGVSTALMVIQLISFMMLLGLLHVIGPSKQATVSQVKSSVATPSPDEQVARPAPRPSQTSGEHATARPAFPGFARKTGDGSGSVDRGEIDGSDHSDNAREIPQGRYGGVADLGFG